MTIVSMTGFARAEGTTDGCAWTWEIRSVNARGLEVRCRLANGFEGLEPAVRQKVATVIKRGNLFVALSLSFSGRGTVVQINEAALDAVLRLLPRIQRLLPDATPPNAAAILGLRGIIEVQDGLPTGEARAELETRLLHSLAEALSMLDHARRREGQRLGPALASHVARITALCREAEALAAAQPQRILNRLTEQLAALVNAVPPLSPDRLAQEAALLAVKADPREELDRLRAHSEAALELLQRDGPVGRHLDFLCQELNREANTLCSKSSDVELTRVGIHLKTAIDQLREQVQNIE